MALSSRVRIVEVGPRDGLQNIDDILPTELKIALIRKLSETGLKIIEATSFVSPKWIPQLSDGHEVMKAIQPLIASADIRYPVLVPNVKGLEAAVSAGAREVGVFVSATEGFSQKNQNCSIAEALARAKAVTDRAIPLGIQVRAYASCILSCPYDGPTDPDQVLQVTKALLQMGCFEVSLGDTLGVGTPAQVKRLLNVLLKEIPVSHLAGHFHDTYGQAVANAVTAYDMGMRVFDSSVAGLGGCPYSPGARGNLASEDIVYTFEKMGIRTGIDLEKLVEVGDWISKKIGLQSSSRAGTALYSKKHNKEPARTPKTLPSSTKSEWVLQDTTQEYKVFRRQHSLKILLTRPKNGNALTVSMLNALTLLLEKLALDPSIFHIVIAAEGRYFCTGMDLSSSGATESSSAKDAKEAQFSGLLRLFEAIDSAPQTTIAAIGGSCFGGGVGLAFTCDIRLAVADARFTLTEVKLGLCPATISKYLAREWGLSFTREAILSAREIKTAELHDKIGAIHGIARDQVHLEALVEERLQQLGKCAPKASGKSKELVRAAYQYPGGIKQAEKIREVFDWMIRPSDEAAYGTDQFRSGKREVDWGAFVDRKTRSKL